MRLNLVGNVRNHLDRLPQIIPATLLGDHIKIDTTRCYIVFLRHPLVQKALVVSEIQIRFRTIVGYIHFAVFVRVHGSRIHVDVGIQLLNSDTKSAGDEKAAQRCANDAFSERRCDPSGHDNVFGRHGEIGLI